MKKLFLFCFVLALMALAAVQAQQKATPEEQATYLTSVLMKDKLGLDASQLEEVKAINLEMLENIEEAKANKESFSSLREYSANRNEQLEEVLSGDQYQRFEANLPFFRKEMNAKFGKQ